jgi:hypothetical protein
MSQAFGRQQAMSNIETIFPGHELISIVLAADKMLDNSIDSGAIV